MEVELRGKNKIKVEIDEEDYERVMEHCWCSQGVYQKAMIKNKQVLLHRFIICAQKGDIIDHIDGNRLNNKKSNLRFCTSAGNNRNAKKSKANTTGFKGVSFEKERNKYRAQITVNYKLVWLGSYNTPEEAHKVYCEAAIKYHGDFACFG